MRVTFVAELDPEVDSLGDAQWDAYLQLKKYLEECDVLDDAERLDYEVVGDAQDNS